MKWGISGEATTPLMVRWVTVVVATETVQRPTNQEAAPLYRHTQEFADRMIYSLTVIRIFMESALMK